ncbi:MAG: TolC family protein [Flavobacteriales bacterium]|nr:TolC family protein [Flavobacteriales bacterium]
MNSIKWFLWAFLSFSSAVYVDAQVVQRRVLSIEDMYSLAEQNSHAIRSAFLAEKEAEHGVKVAKNAMLPQIDASLSFSYIGDGWLSDRNFTNGEVADMPELGNNFALEASQVIYAGGAVSHAVGMAKLAKEIASLDVEKNRQDIRFLLVGNYLELYKLKNQCAVYVQNIEQTKRLLDDIKAKENQGLALKNDITRYELQLKNLELALTQVQNSQTIINNQLVTVLGLSANTVIDVDTSIVNALPLVSDEKDWQNTASVASPILRQSEIGVKMSKKNEKLVRAEAMPSVAVFAADRFDGPIIIEVPPLNKNFNYWYVGVGLKYNIASTFKTGKKSAQAKISTLRAEQERALLMDNVQMGVKEAYVRFVESFTIFQTQEKSLELAEQNYAVINNRYLNDLALITDMLDASNAKLSAQLQVANARVNILFNYYRLKKASGNI